MRVIKTVSVNHKNRIKSCKYFYLWCNQCSVICLSFLFSLFLLFSFALSLSFSRLVHNTTTSVPRRIENSYTVSKKFRDGRMTLQGNIFRNSFRKNVSLSTLYTSELHNLNEPIRQEITLRYFRHPHHWPRVYHSTYVRSALFHMCLFEMNRAMSSYISSEIDKNGSILLPLPPSGSCPTSALDENRRSSTLSMKEME